MEKSALIFIGIILFSTCTPILARTGYLPCKNNADCIRLKCPTPFGKPTCVNAGCECPLERFVALPDDTNTNCGVATCIDYCKAKGEQAYACIMNRCYCHKPPM
ncbi:PREDICTED: putative defensin-like protein 307 [Camelina sativa]|uniref:Defensin-like protein 307 n=1 Tax=Camelina sativa TaxID=90675 RepID=A0ABM0U1X0_CAMSA|nr:PREDICTED: putative defensin-like protein 307 [Camelina sativa]